MKLKLQIKYLTVFLILVSIINFACKSENSNNVEVVDNNLINKPIIKFNETEFDFGEIISGEKVSHRFKFKNIGEGKLNIKKTIADCGCSSVKIGENPTSSGEESYIEITFDSRGFHGLQIKNIEIFTNVSKEPINLIVSANVEISK